MPRLLDLFCGAGGAAMGYRRAGFDIVGVDINPQPNYPFEFVQADAMTYPLDGFEAIHASPPCQHYSVANNIHGRTDHPDLLPATKARLVASRIPWVIENVPGAPMLNFVMLCGDMFGLGVIRHRWFETSFFVWNPTPCRQGHPDFFVSVFGGGAKPRRTGRGFPKGAVPHRRASEAMGVGWMTQQQLSQAIPPAYTQYIGEQLLTHLAVAA